MENYRNFFLNDSISNVNNDINQNFSPEDAKIILTPFNKLANNVFVKNYWEKNISVITSYIDLLDKLWVRWAGPAYNNIESFFEINMPSEIVVYIIPCERGLAGGSNLSGKGITLEIGSTNVTLGNILEVMMHELIHFVSNAKTIKLLINNNAPEPYIVEEAIVATLASNSGLLSSKIKLSKGEVVSLPKQVEYYKQKIRESIAVRLEKKTEDYEVFIKRIVEQIKNT